MLSAQRLRRLRRIVVATMHTDIVPLSYIRARCRVYHRERLPEDLDDYKKSPDSFYFHQVRVAEMRPI